MKMSSHDEKPFVCPQLLAEFLRWNVILQLAIVREIFDHISALEAT